MSEPVSTPPEPDGDAPAPDDSRRKLLFGLLAGGVAAVVGAIAYLTLHGGGATPVAVSPPPLIAPSSATPSSPPPPSLAPATGQPIDPFKALYRDTTVAGGGSPTTGTGGTGGTGSGDTGGLGGGDTGSGSGDTGGLGGGDTGSGSGDTGGLGGTDPGTGGLYVPPYVPPVPPPTGSPNPTTSPTHTPTPTTSPSHTATPTTSPTHTVSPPPPPPSGPVLPVAGKLVVYRAGSTVPADCTSLPAYRVQVKNIAGVVLQSATLAAGVPSKRPHGAGYRCTYAYTVPLAEPLQAYYIFSAGPATGTGPTSNFVVADVLVKGGHGPDLKLGD